MREIHTEDELASYISSRGSLQGVRLQGLDLRAHKRELFARSDFQGTVILGGTVGVRLERHLRAHGAIVFPGAPNAPVDPYRARLYHPSELYAGLSQGGYAVTPDARAYAWATSAQLARDTYVTTLRAIHDDAMSDALSESLDGLPVVGVMGGHAMHRGTPHFAAAAVLGHRLADAGLVVMTGGGPGAMEAANLGAYARHESQLPAALTVVGTVASFEGDITAWARAAFHARRMLGNGSEHPDRPRSIGVPTWFYGHEPPNVFCDGIAKYFSNALREDGLIARCSAGVVVLPGAAGTVQEVFQAVTPMFYAAADATVPPLVLVGREHWSERVPIWPTVQALAQGHAMAGRIHLVDGVQEAVDALTTPQ